MQLPIDLLIDNPLLTLFFVAGVGYLLGRLRLLGASLGIAAVLFVGIAVGALDPKIKLPEVIQQLGLVIFVYTLGLSSGPGFVASLRKRGLMATVFTIGILLVTGAIWFAASRQFGLSAGLSAGGFTGSVTNTAALAAIIEMAGGSIDPGVGYSIAYPGGVLGLLIVMGAYASKLRKNGRLIPPKKAGLTNATFRVTSPEVIGVSIRDLMADHSVKLIFGRLRRGDQLLIAESHVVLESGDLLTAVGTAEDIQKAVGMLGEIATERLDFDRSEVDYRRYFVSNPALFGKSLAELQLPQNYSAVMTRISRGDVEFLPEGTTVLEPGDRVRVLTHRDNIPAISKLLGDSYRALSEIDILSFGLGICLGLLVGLIEVPLPGGLVFKLGVAGGPLVVSLILGAIQHTGPIHWGLSYSANLTLRQIGLILFLAGVGVRSGAGFKEAMMSTDGLIIMVVGLLATVVTAALFLTIGSKIFKVNGATLLGMVAAVHTQPAALGFAVDQTKGETPNVGYAMVFPIASVSKILLGQLLYQLLR